MRLRGRVCVPVCVLEQVTCGYCLCLVLMGVLNEHSCPAVRVGVRCVREVVPARRLRARVGLCTGARARQEGGGRQPLAVVRLWESPRLAFEVW